MMYGAVHQIRILYCESGLWESIHYAAPVITRLLNF